MGENREILITDMAKIIALCTSKHKGTEKQPISEAIFIENYGIQGDSHAGQWHRQVSLLNKEAIDDFNAKGGKVTYGAFGENIVVEGLDLASLKVGDILTSNDLVLEITQKGKECHDHCAIYYRVGECIMPRLGVFAVVTHGGVVHPDDEIKQIERSEPLPFQAAVITLSDSCSRKEKEDVSGPTLVTLLKENGYQVIETILLPDEKTLLKKELIRLCDQRQVDLILTTGGTGFTARDITPEATLEVMEKNAPGIAEAIRAESLKITSHAMLSRAVAVIRGKSLIINFPGSPKACEEAFRVIKEALPHGIGLLRGSIRDCARINKKH